ncbi:MAG: hypothetical protein ACOC5T_10415, partial [Elusimicrobiota bacterium]
WNSLSWKEIIIICILIIGVMTYIKLNVATYHIECRDGSIEEIEPGKNYGVCGDSMIDFNAYTGHIQVTDNSDIDIPESEINLSEVEKNG